MPRPSPGATARRDRRAEQRRHVAGRAAAPGAVHSRDQEPRCVARGVPSQPSADGDRARRVRRHPGAGYARGPARRSSASTTSPTNPSAGSAGGPRRSPARSRSTTSQRSFTSGSQKSLSTLRLGSCSTASAACRRSATRCGSMAYAFGCSESVHLDSDGRDDQQRTSTMIPVPPATPATTSEHPSY